MLQMSQHSPTVCQPLGPEVPRHSARPLISLTAQELGSLEGLTLSRSPLSQPVQVPGWKRSPSCSCCCAEREEWTTCWVWVESTGADYAGRGTGWLVVPWCHLALGLLMQWLPLTLRVSTENQSPAAPLQLPCAFTPRALSPLCSRLSFSAEPPMLVMGWI